MRRFALGVDFGTTKVACALVDLEKGTVVACASTDTNAYVPSSNSLHHEQDPNEIKKAFIGGITACMKRFEGEIVSIGLTGQMHGIVGIDETGGAVTNLVTWQDERGGERTESGRTLLEEMEARGGKRQVATGYGIVTLFDWTVHGRIRGIRAVSTIPDYFGMLLTGRTEPVMDYTMADSTGAFDGEKEAWDKEYIVSLDIDPLLFPEIVPPTSVLGYLQEQDLRDRLHGCRAPVSVAIGDNQASYIGSVREFTQTILVNIGTASQISYGIEARDEAQRYKTANGYDVVVRPFVEGLQLVSGNALSGGCSYARLKRFFEEVGKELFGVAASNDLWDKMFFLASERDGSDGLSVYPLFWGKRSDPGCRGRIEEVGDQNFTPANLIYGTLYGVVEILREMVDDSVIRQRRWVVGSGNALRRNDILQRIVGEIFKKGVLVPQFEEEAAVGAAINGAVACGAAESFRHAGKVIRYG